MEPEVQYFVGTAGWTIPKPSLDQFGPDGSHLERYANRFNAVEINSSFYRNHKADTYSRWRDSVPNEFRFSVKLSKEITHEDRLRSDAGKIADLVHNIAHLKEKLGVLLIQLPPSLEFNQAVARQFFENLRQVFRTRVAIEPRHKTWISPDALDLLNKFQISKVVADPERSPAEDPGHTTSFKYFRLHGSPEMYKSSYDGLALENWLKMMTERDHFIHSVWAIFDNTTLGFATQNALTLKHLLSSYEAPHL